MFKIIRKQQIDYFVQTIEMAGHEQMRLLDINKKLRLDIAKLQLKVNKLNGSNNDGW